MLNVIKSKKGFAFSTVLLFVTGTAILVAGGEYVARTQEQVAEPNTTVNGFASAEKYQSARGLNILRDIKKP